MTKILRIIIFTLVVVILNSCGGTIDTVKYSKINSNDYKRAYIISSENSEYIKFKFGTLTYVGYIPPKDGKPEKTKTIGNTDTIIKKELEKYGIHAIIGKRNDIPENFDLIVEYRDKWRWDFKKVLDELEIYFISPSGDKVLSKSKFEIHKSKEFHNFPSPKKEVPRMIKELLGK